jgi:hypothetical protein
MQMATLIPVHSGPQPSEPWRTQGAAALHQVGSEPTISSDPRVPKIPQASGWTEPSAAIAPTSCQRTFRRNNLPPPPSELCSPSWMPLACGEQKRLYGKITTWNIANWRRPRRACPPASVKLNCSTLASFCDSPGLDPDLSLRPFAEPVISIDVAKDAGQLKFIEGCDTNTGCLSIFAFCFPDQATISAAQSVASLHDQQNAGGTTFTLAEATKLSLIQAVKLPDSWPEIKRIFFLLAPSAVGRKRHRPHRISSHGGTNERTLGQVRVKGKSGSPLRSGTPPIRPLPQLDMGQQAAAQRNGRGTSRLRIHLGRPLPRQMVRTQATTPYGAPARSRTNLGSNGIGQRKLAITGSATSAKPSARKD